MCREVIRNCVLGLAVLSAGAFSACSTSSSADAAQELLNQAEQLKETGRYEEALLLLDSIDHAYAPAVDVRRQGMQLRPLLIEQVTSRQLEAADSIAALSAYRLDSLSRLMIEVSNPIENYFVPKSEGKTTVSSTPGLHARMAPDGKFYLIASSTGHNGMTSFSLSCSGEIVQAPVVGYDGERNDRSGGVDVITYVEGDCQEVGDFILNHRSDPITVSFNGRQTATTTLSEAQKQGIAVVFEAASLIRERKKQEIERQRLERMLQTVRSQIARTVQDTIPEQ